MFVYQSRRSYFNEGIDFQFVNCLYMYVMAIDWHGIILRISPIFAEIYIYR